MMAGCDPEIPKDHLQQFEICRKCLGGKWASLPLTRFCVRRFGGGMSNDLYLCSVPDSERTINGLPRKALFRVYGKVSRTTTNILTFNILSERKLGPKLLGMTEEARMEEYIPTECLHAKDLRDQRLSGDIARTLKTFHFLKMPVSRVPCLDRCMDKWLDQSIVILNKQFNHENSNSCIDGLRKLDLAGKKDTLMKTLASIQSPVVFAHNDLQEGNILRWNKSPTKLVFIDVEYAAYNYRGFDIANHFLEWCFDYEIEISPGFHYDPSLFPTKDEQTNFFESYLGLPTTGSTSTEALSDLYREVDAFIPASHLYWGLWSIVMFNDAPHGSQFKYLEYAVCRLDAFDKWMQEHDAEKLEE